MFGVRPTLNLESSRNEKAPASLHNKGEGSRAVAARPRAG